MSIQTEVCLKYKGTLEELKVDVEKVLGMQFQHYECGSKTLRAYYGNLLTLDIELSTNYLETDRDLNYSDFEYVLGTRVAGGHACAQRLLQIQVPMSDTIGLLLCYYLDVEVMVTVEVQKLHARYKPEEVKQDSGLSVIVQAPVPNAD
jgi:hypothetical protein